MLHVSTATVMQPYTVQPAAALTMHLMTMLCVCDQSPATGIVIDKVFWLPHYAWWQYARTGHVDRRIQVSSS